MSDADAPRRHVPRALMPDLTDAHRSALELAQHPVPHTAPPPERYVDRRELADIMGVSIATVDRMAAEGMPSVTWGRQ